MLRRDAVILYETSGSKHSSKHISLKSKGDVHVRENKYPMAMKSQSGLKHENTRAFSSTSPEALGHPSQSCLTLMWFLPTAEI